MEIIRIRVVFFYLIPLNNFQNFYYSRFCFLSNHWIYISPPKKFFLCFSTSGLILCLYRPAQESFMLCLINSSPTDRRTYGEAVLPVPGYPEFCEGSERLYFRSRSSLIRAASALSSSTDPVKSRNSTEVKYYTVNKPQRVRVRVREKFLSVFHLQ